jgi:hypothetical protein
MVYEYFFINGGMWLLMGNSLGVGLTVGGWLVADF